jgi:MFS transporter, ACS family, tartrate transporter
VPGWRWVFILEAAPAVVLGCVTFLTMTDRPQRASPDFSPVRE